MTQNEFDAAVSAGKVTVETDAQAEQENGASTPDLSSTPITQFIPLLTQLQGVQNYLTAAPTFTPQSFQEQVQFVYTGGIYYLYVWINNGWRKATFT